MNDLSHIVFCFVYAQVTAGVVDLLGLCTHEYFLSLNFKEIFQNSLRNR